MQIQMETLAPEHRNKKPAPAELGFGKVFTDHMLVADWQAGRGWYDPRIVPYGPFLLEPSAAVFHYGQEVFEGLKAFRGQDGRVALFRPEEHLARFNRSATRVALPEIEQDIFLDGLCELLRLEREWVPTGEGTALYIRPAMIATEPVLGVKPSGQCRFFMILSPVGAYSGKSGRILVEEQLVRAVPGGTGGVKTGGNYAASMLAAQRAADKGFDQVLWLDGIEHHYIEEAGAMNIFFVTETGLVTPQLSGSFLPGITRDSILRLAPTLGMAVEERPISLDEVMAGLECGRVREIFATGTAAVLWPITALGLGESIFPVGNGRLGPQTERLRKVLLDIQYSRVPDRFHWLRFL